MRLNLSKFKLKHHDGKTAILAHPDGHEMKVAIHALHPESRKELMKVKASQDQSNPKLEQSKVKLAKGGTVSGDEMSRPCLNPNCKSHGHPHPNCQCYAKGGEVTKGCKHCMADGGEAMPTPMPNVANPEAQLPSDSIKDAPMEGVEPEGSPIDMIVAPIGAKLGSAMAGDAAAIAGNEIGTLGARSGAPNIEVLDRGMSTKAPMQAQRAAKEAMDVLVNKLGPYHPEAKAAIARFQAALDAGNRQVSQVAGRKGLAEGGEAKKDQEMNSGAASQSMPRHNYAAGDVVDSGPQLPQYQIDPSGQLETPSQVAAPVNPAPQMNQYAPPAANQSALSSAAPETQAASPTTPVPPTAVPSPPSPSVQQAAQDINQGAVNQAALQKPNDPYGNETFNQAYLQGLGEQKAGIMLDAQGNTAMGAAQAKAASTQINELQQSKLRYDKEYKDLDDQRKHLVDDIMNQHIDPNQAWHDKGTLSKVSTGIGLILGGLGSGMTGGPNQALEFLNKQIDRSIEAQKMDLNKKNTLLSHNLAQFHNMATAVDVTRSQLMAITSAQLQKAAGQNAGTMAASRALMQAGALDQAAAPIISKVAMTRSMQNGGGTPQAGEDKSISKMDPTHAMMVRMKPYFEMQGDPRAKLVDEHYIPGEGWATTTVPKESRDQLVGMNQLDSAAKDLLSFAKEHTGSWNPQTIAQGHEKMQALQSMYQQARLGGIYKAGEQPLLEKVVGKDPTSLFNFFSNIPKLEEVISSNNRMKNVLRQSMGLPQGPTSNNLTPQQSLIREWAMRPENKSNPKAQMALKKLSEI